MLDLGRYDFGAGDAGPGAPLQGGGSLAPVPSSDGDAAAPEAAPGPVRASPIEGGLSPSVDAGSASPIDLPLAEPIPAQPLPTQPAPTDPVPSEPVPTEPVFTDPVPGPPDPTPPVATPPPSRPVLVGDVLSGSAFAGAQEGDERLGLCGSGSVMVGVSFYFYPAGAGDRLGFLAPVCARFGDDPAAPLDWTRDDAALFWAQSDELLSDPPLPLAGQLLGELVCPPPLVVTGARGFLDAAPPTAIVRDVTLECAPVNEVFASSQVVADRGSALLIASGALPFVGPAPYAIGCDDGSAAVAVFESSGTWLDGFALGCTPLRRPRLAGDACNAGDACQSGVCSAGSCAAP